MNCNNCNHWFIIIKFDFISLTFDNDGNFFCSYDVSPLVIFLVGCDVLEIFQTYREEETSAVSWFLQFYSGKETKLGIFSPSIHWWIVSILIIFYFLIREEKLPVDHHGSGSCHPGQRSRPKYLIPESSP